MRSRVLVALGLLLFAAGHASAQAPSRPGPWVLDVRGATSPVPNEPVFYPPLDSSAFIPKRGFGLDIGAHVYLFDLGAARVGVGAVVATFRSTAQAPAPIAPAGSPPGPAPLRQRVVMQMVHMSPQVSFNFGSRTGWSYVSAGMGSSVVSTRTSEVNPGTRKTGELWDVSRFTDVGGFNAINFGGGARWFLNSHLAFGFDLRFYRMDAGTAGEVVLTTSPLVDPGEPGDPPPPVRPVLPLPTPGKMFVTAGAGVSIR